MTLTKAHIESWNKACDEADAYALAQYGTLIPSLEQIVEQVSSRLAGDEGKGPETRPTVNPPVLPELICEECGDPATVISKDFKLCADCAEEMRRNYVDDPGRLRPSERFS